MLAAVLVFGMMLTGCDSEPEPEPPPVEEKYQFTNADWTTSFGGDAGKGTATLGRDSFTVTAASADYSFSYTGVYTEGGAALNSGITWAYLYDASGKIGYVIGDSTRTFAAIGRFAGTILWGELQQGGVIGLVVDYAGMQTDHDGAADTLVK